MTDSDTFHTIQPTNGRPAIRFEGRLMAEVSGERPGQLRWAELKAYQTKSGRWIVEQTGMTTVEGEEVFKDVLIFDTADDMTAKVGFGRLAEKLWMKLGFDTVTIR
ncbi:MAG: hypothetical protein LPK02_07230 [Rhodobacterales bacterium]|nr:hypothetical protein [Rhodobacterales bacterium]